MSDAPSITPVPAEVRSHRRAWFVALVIAICALAACVLVATAAWWLYPRIFPVETVDLRPGDTYVAASGLTIRVPGTEAVQVVRLRHPVAGIAEKLEFTSLHGGDSADVFSYSQPEKNRVITNVGKMYDLAGATADRGVEVRWHDWVAGSSSLAIITRLPSYDVGMVLTYGTPHLGTAAAARAAARRLWSELSVQGARLP